MKVLVRKLKLNSFPRGRWCALLLLILLIIFSSECVADVDRLYLLEDADSSYQQTNLLKTAHYYGIKIDWSIQPEDLSQAMLAKMPPEKLPLRGDGWVAFSATRLEKMNEGEIEGLKKWVQMASSGTRVFIYGILPSHIKQIRWLTGISDLKIQIVSMAGRPPFTTRFQFSNHEDWGPLSGIDVPDEYSFLKSQTVLRTNFSDSGTHIRLHDEKVAQESFSLLTVNISGVAIYLAGHVELDVTLFPSNQQTLTPSEWVHLMPYYTFLNKPESPHLWRFPRRSANFTIDDPWLRSEYGHMDFKGMFTEMERVGYHLTIAFIPYNYDRGDKDVVDLVRENPHRFSLCIHGNNHDHAEFDVSSGRTIQEHNFNLCQGLARLDRMANEKGIPYGRVMVFPHRIADSEVLNLLRRQKFLSTVNSSMHPNWGQNNSRSQGNRFWPFTLEHGGLLSLKRRGAVQSLSSNERARIATDLYLGFPVLRHIHQQDLVETIMMLNPTAEFVNSVSPNIKWVGLDKLTRSLYRVRLSEDGVWEVEAYSPEIDLEIPSRFSSDEVEVVLRKPGVESFAVCGVSLAGESVAYEEKGDTLYASLSVLSGKPARVKVSYCDELKSCGDVSLEKDDFRIDLLRAISDFRDIHLSKMPFGDAIFNFYYSSGIHKGGLKVVGASLVFVIGALGLLIFGLRRRRQKQRLK